MKKKGMVLLLASFIILITSIFLIGYLDIASSETEIMRNHRFSTQAFYIGEAGLQSGIRYVLDNLSSDSDWSDNEGEIYSNVSFGDGEYSVQLIDGTTSTINVQAESEMNGFIRTITQTLTKISSACAAFSYACHTNANINLRDASEGTITGDISVGGSANTRNMEMDIDGEITESSEISLPEVDYASYQAIADYVISGNYTFEEGETYTGVYYITGNANFEDDVTLNGTVIVPSSNKKIKMNDRDSVTITPSGNNPALVSAGGITMKETDSINITGLIYSEKAIDLREAVNSVFNGTLICGDKLNLREIWRVDITYNEEILSDPPPYFSSDALMEGVELSSWQEN